MNYLQPVPLPFFCSTVYNTSCPILLCLANAHFPLLSPPLEATSPPSVPPNRTRPRPQSRDRTAVFIDLVLSRRNMCAFRVVEVDEERFVFFQKCLYLLVFFWNTPSSRRTQAEECFRSERCQHGGKMRSRCRIHMLRLSGLPDTQTRCLQYVEEWVGAKRIREGQTSVCVCVCAKAQECGCLNTLETLFEGMLTNKRRVWWMWQDFTGSGRWRQIPLKLRLQSA